MKQKHLRFGYAFDIRLIRYFESELWGTVQHWEAEVESQRGVA